MFLCRTNKNYLLSNTPSNLEFWILHVGMFVYEIFCAVSLHFKEKEAARSMCST